MKDILLSTLLALSLTGCESKLFKKDVVQGQVESELSRAAQGRAIAAAPDAVNQALLPPLTVEMPKVSKPLEPRFDLVVNNAPANQVFMALVSGTRYSMLVHPDIQGTISVNLKDVTLFEALEAIRELHGYEYKTQDTRIYIQPVALQTRLFQVNYLAGRRVGRADVRVTSGSIQAPSSSAPIQPPSATGAAAPAPVSAPASGGAQSIESSRVTTTSNNDYWAEINDSIVSIIGKDRGRSVVVNASAGVILVRAMPSELRSVEQYLKAMSLAVERQVMLEAKIVEVMLSDQFSTGINWAVFRNFGSAFYGNIGAGALTPGTTLSPTGTLSSPIGRGPDGLPLADSNVTANLTTSTFASAANIPGSVLGIALQTASFAALLNFLESQGTVHVLSSPRIATLNNQKAVIKVGTDEFFVTNITTTSSSFGTSTTVSPTITVAPFFSGIALDVTPQISDDDQITLHIHPTVSLVTDKTKTLNLGTLGTYTLPLASSNVNESDTIVRVQDGTIAAIGGLMRQQQNNTNSGLPGSSESPVLGGIFGSRNRQLNKSELVILLKTTIIKGDGAWQREAQEINERMQTLRRSDPDRK